MPTKRTRSRRVNSSSETEAPSTSPLAPRLSPDLAPNFQEIGWSPFQGLCRDLLGVQPEVATSAVYGPAGQAQLGIDILAQLKEPGAWVGQSKCYGKISPAAIKRATDEFLAHADHWQKQGAKRFFLFAACEVSRTELLDEMVAQRQRLEDVGLEYEVWDSNTLASRLGPHRAVAARYLPPWWVDKLCGGPPGDHGLLPAGPAGTTAFVIAQFDAVGQIVDIDTRREIDRIRDLANQGRPNEALAAVQAVRSTSARWLVLRPETRARLLRIEAAVVMQWKRALATVRGLLVEADALDAANTVTAVHAQLTELEHGPQAALALLEGRQGLPERSTKARLLVELHRPAEALTALDLDGTGLSPDSEIHRWRAIAYLHSGDVTRARLEAQRALEMAPTWAAVRFTAAMVDYFAALSPLARPTHLVPWPHPIRWEMVRREDEATARVLLAERAFAELMRTPDLDVDDRKNMETWRLACLAVNPQRAPDAEQFCRALLDADPLHCQALLWALVRGWRVTPKRHVEALAHRAHTKEASVLEWLTLVALEQRMRRSDRALNFLRLGRPTFEATDNGPLWRFWRTQLLIAANRGEEAAEELATEGVEMPSAAALLRLAAARKTEEYDEYVDYCARIFRDSRDGSHLLEACQVLAQRKRWAHLLSQVDFLRWVGTVDAMRLAAAAAWHCEDAARCLALLDEARALSPGDQLAGDLRAVRIHCLTALGHLSEASSEAELLAREEPTTVHLLNLVRVLATKLDTRGATVEARRLIGRSDLPARDALDVVALIQPDDPETARTLWRQATAGELTDALVAYAFHLGARLEIGPELNALLPRLATAAERGKEIRIASIDELKKLIEERRAHGSQLDALYRRAEAPLHFIAHEWSLPLAYPYHQQLLERAAPGAPPGMLLARWGGRPPITGFPILAAEIRLHLDVSGLLLGAHLGILDAVEATFAPIRIAHGTATALLSIRDELLPLQPERIAAMQTVQDLVDREKLVVSSGTTAMPWSVILLEAPGAEEDWVQQLSQAHASNGVLLDFTSAVSELHSSPEVRSALVNCGAVARSLRRLGVLSAQQLETAVSRLGVEGAELESDPDLSRGAFVVVRAGVATLLATAKILDSACAAFRVHIASSEYEQCRAATGAAPQRQALRSWIDALITRLRDGIGGKKYQVLSAPPAIKSERRVPRGSGDSLIELLMAPHTPGDVLWIDDRTIGRLSGSWPVGVAAAADVVAALHHYGAVDGPQLYEMLLRMRREGLFFVPIHSGELLHHIAAAPMNDGELVETEELATLRRYFARAFDSGALVFPPVASPNDAGEHPFVLGLLHAVEATLVQVWKSDRSNQEKGAVSEWLWSAFGLHEVQGLRLGSKGPQPELLTARLATLLGIAIGFGIEEEEKQRRDDYLQWLGARLVSPRVAVDPAQAVTVASLLRRTLLESLLKDAPGKGRRHRRGVQALVAEFVENLPSVVSDELRRDPSLTKALGQKRTALVSISKWRFAHPEMWNAAAVAVRDGTSAVTTVGGQSASIEAEAAARPVSLKFRIGQETFSVTDPLNSLLLPSVDERQRALNERRTWFDMDNGSFAQLSAEVATLSSPADRIDEALSWRDRSTTVAYEGLRAQIRVGGNFEWSQIEPPPIQSLRGRLRLPAAGPWAEVIGGAAETLVREEGLLTALHRLSALPCALPAAIGEALAADTAEGRRSIALAFSSGALSPTARFHAVRLALASGDPELEGEAKRHTTSLASEGAVSSRAFVVLLAWAWDELSHRAEKEDWTTRLACAWLHAHEVYSIMRGCGLSDDWIAGLAARKTAHPASLFGGEPTSRQDLAGVTQSTEEALLLYGLAYGIELLPAGAAVLSEVDGSRFSAQLSLGNAAPTRFPRLALLRNRSLAPNGLGSFLHWRPSVDRLLPDEIATVIRPEKLGQWTNEHLNRLANDTNELRVWFDLACIVGDLRLAETGQQESLLAAITAADFERLAAPPADARAVLIALHFMCLQLAYGVSKPTEAEPVVLKAARALASRWPRAHECSDDLWLLLEACALAARGPWTPAASAARMADLMRRVLIAWPTVAPMMRSTVQALSDQLPLEESKELWSLLTYLRAVT